MGQYFKLINYDKQEVVNAWSLDQGAKFWEWEANNISRLAGFLLRKSNESGGGDIEDEGEYCGYWAGDRIALVGDYDESGDYNKVETEKWTDISKGVAHEFNKFIQNDDYKIYRRLKNDTYKPI